MHELFGNIKTLETTNVAFIGVRWALVADHIRRRTKKNFFRFSVLSASSTIFWWIFLMTAVWLLPEQSHRLKSFLIHFGASMTAAGILWIVVGYLRPSAFASHSWPNGEEIREDAWSPSDILFGIIGAAVWPAVAGVMIAKKTSDLRNDPWVIVRARNDTDDGMERASLVLADFRVQNLLTALVSAIDDWNRAIVHSAWRIEGAEVENHELDEKENAVFVELMEQREEITRAIALAEDLLMMGPLGSQTDKKSEDGSMQAAQIRMRKISERANLFYRIASAGSSHKAPTP